MKFGNQTFTTDITLDHNEFVDCIIRDCSVHYHGGPFSLTRTTMERVAFRLHGPAAGTLAFLRMVQASWPQAFAQLLGPASTPPQRLN